MSNRTTDAKVRKIIEVDDDIWDDSFIESANALVTDVCVPLGYDDVRLELIERWLAAHFYAVRDRRTDMEKAGNVSVKYDTKVDLYIANTSYGQQAMLFDTKGGLMALNRLPQVAVKPRVQVAFVGGNPPGQYNPTGVPTVEP